MATSVNTASVVQSAIVSNNTAMGGHLTQHIRGAQPPAGLSQITKTLFGKGRDFEAVWRQYTYLPYMPAGLQHVSCSGHAVSQRVSLASLGIQWLECYSCTAVDAGGAYTAGTLYCADAIFFGFVSGPRGWILNTAYPEPLL